MAHGVAGIHVDGRGGARGGARHSGRAEFPELSPAPQPQLSFAEMDDNQLLAAALEASRVEPSPTPTPTAAPSAALRPSSPRESWSRATEGMTAAPSVVQQALLFLDEAGAGRGARPRRPCIRARAPRILTTSAVEGT